MDLEEQLRTMLGALSGECFIESRATFAVLARATETYINTESGGLRAEYQARFTSPELVRLSASHRARITEKKIRSDFPALFFGNLPPDVKTPEIEDVCRLWEILHIYIGPYQLAKSSAWAKVYMTDTDVAAALDHFATNPPDIRGRQVLVTRATVKSPGRGKS